MRRLFVLTGFVGVLMLPFGRGFVAYGQSCSPPCRMGQECCQGLCCEVGETCTADHCCPTAQACGSLCCFAGQTCTGNGCCPTARACGDTCCPQGEVCSANVCVLAPTGTPTDTPTNTPTSTPTSTPTATPTNTPVPQGGACATPAQCSTGFCVDSVCCDTACTEPLMRCNLAGQAGTCASTAAAAPTLTPWGLIVAAVMLVSVAAFALRHRIRSH
jgi:hypothetical protein